MGDLVFNGGKVRDSPSLSRTRTDVPSSVSGSATNNSRPVTSLSTELKPAYMLFGTVSRPLITGPNNNLHAVGGWTFQGLTLNNCVVSGFDMNIGTKDGTSQGVGAEAFVDVVVTNSPIFLRTTAASTGTLDGSIVLSNVKLTNVPMCAQFTIYMLVFLSCMQCCRRSRRRDRTRWRDDYDLRMGTRERLHRQQWHYDLQARLDRKRAEGIFSSG